MGYYDDYDDYEEVYGVYDEQLELINLVAEECTEKDITDTLMNTGFLIECKPKWVCTMEKIVFVYGNPNEVYSPNEIRFIESINDVYVYPEFFKNLNKGSMTCRVIAAQINCTEQEAIKACLSFEKIINKALDGFNIFFFVTRKATFFGCRIFDKTGKHDCILSKPVQLQSELERIQDEFSFLTITDDFMNFYEQYMQVIVDKGDKNDDYDNMIFQKKGIQFGYLDAIDKFGRDVGINMSTEKERYRQLFDKVTELSFLELVEEVEEDLGYIKSNRVNTYELLFEADEMMRQADIAEKERNSILSQNSEVEHEEAIDAEIENAINDPETVIKLLKKKRGI